LGETGESLCQNEKLEKEVVRRLPLSLFRLAHYLDRFLARAVVRLEILPISNLNFARICPSASAIVSLVDFRVIHFLNAINFFKGMLSPPQRHACLYALSKVQSPDTNF
jgi:hypothetical protein